MVLHESIIQLLMLSIIVLGQQRFNEDCDDEDTPQSQRACIDEQLKQNSVDGIERTIPDFESLPPMEANARGQSEENPYDCMTLTCLCPHFNGESIGPNECILSDGQSLKLAIRKEYRVLSDDERRRYHDAVIQLKRNGEFDRLGREHQSVGIRSGAHSGPGFLPWHREYLKRYEIALRLIDPTIAIPYWDSVLDSYLPDPRDSILFSSNFVGTTNSRNEVIDGPFVNWLTLDSRTGISRISGREGRLFTEYSIRQVIRQEDIASVLAYTAPFQGCPYSINYAALEYSHSNVHLWVGGHMREASTSSNDPLFYSHHSFIDLIWELWRQRRQSRQSRESDYPEDHPLCADRQHFSNAPMRPYFHLSNQDGLSNLYTDRLYRYALRPHCTADVPTCKSEYLFCDTKSFHCVSKIKLGGRCAPFLGLHPCYNGFCHRGRCVAERSPASFPMKKSEIRRSSRRQPSRSNNTQCFNRHQCCEYWSQRGACRRDPSYMGQYCRTACTLCQASFDVNNECADRHSNCRYWARNGYCSERNHNHFMHENCRSTCNLCGVNKSARCRRI